MRRAEVRVCVLRVCGTNCDEETKLAFLDLGAQAEVVHMNQILRGKRRLEDYQVLMLPGGFSYGDYVRAGAIWGRKLIATLRNDINRFIEEEKAVVGICNGFQVLIEAGILPGLATASDGVEAVLTTNASAHYECRWVFLRLESSVCRLTGKVASGSILRMPIGHGEGRFLAPDGVLSQLKENRQITFRYVKPDGSAADGVYPYNPNGSVLDVAGLCNAKGNVMGLMPHPERAYFGWQLPDWTRQDVAPEYADGRVLLESVVEYVEERF